MKKKFLVTVLSFVMAFAFAACGGSFPAVGSSASEKDSSVADSSGKEEETPSIVMKDMLYGVCYIPEERENFSQNMTMDVQLLSNLGVGSVRVWTDFGNVLKNSTTVNEEACENLHKLFARLKAKGIEPVCMSHTSLFKGTNIGSKKYQRDLTKGSDYLVWLTEYYTSWRTLAREFPEIIYWEVGNEINNGDFMKNIDGTAITDMSQMAAISADLLYHGSRGIKSVNFNAKVVMGGLTEVRQLGSGENIAFLNALYPLIFSGEYGYMYQYEQSSKASKDPDDYFDIVCWHPYMHSETITEQIFLTRNQAIYDVVLRYEPEGKEVFLTETGFSDAYMTEEKAASSMRILMTALKKMPYVKAMHYFKTFDVAKVTWTGAYSRYGLFYDPHERTYYSETGADKTTPLPNGGAKPIAYTFQSIAGGSGSLDLLKK